MQTTGRKKQVLSTYSDTLLQQHYAETCRNQEMNIIPRDFIARLMKLLP